MYQIGQQITTRYINAPIPQDRWYEIGAVITIMDNQSQSALAKFRVTETDNTTIKGVIISTI